MLDTLRARSAAVAGLLDSVALGPLPSAPAARAASLNQRAWLLKVGGSIAAGSAKPCTHPIVSL